MTTSNTLTRALFGTPLVVCFATAAVAALSSCGGGGSGPAPANPNLADTPYEPLPTFRASDLLPADLMTGDFHTIAETVDNDGYENRYTIESKFGTFTAHRKDYVAERIREVYAIEELNKISRSDAFAQGVAQAATSPFRALKGLATEPVGTVTGVVRGVGALFSQAGEMITGSRGELEDSAARELVGFGAIKRQVADMLSVDPYTTNQVVQDRLGEVSWAGFAGGLSLAPLTAGVGGGAGVVLSGLQNSQTLKSLLTSQSPEALRGINRDRMEVMGIDEELRETFLLHPWLSPRHETVIVAALMGMDAAANRDALIEEAVIAQSEQQSVFLMRQAEASLGFHQNVAAVTRLERTNRQVLLHSVDNRLISILPADHLAWGLGASIIADQGVDSARAMELWLTGTISDRARAEFTERGWRVVAGMADRLAPDLDAGVIEDDESADQEQAAAGG
jgi:hypothetical protein